MEDTEFFEILKMELQLNRDIVFFDVETTGLNVVRDRILQIGMVKLFKNGRPAEEFSTLINPGIPISEESMSVHGITPKDLANKPTFQQLAQKIWDFMGESDLAGYNSNRFDVPMLMEEFARVGMEFSIENRRLIDVQRIFYKMEPRTLKAAYRFYCQKELADAHDAMADVRATLEVFKGQLTKYDGVDLIDEDGKVVEAPIKNDMKVLHDFTNDLNFLDATQKLKVGHDGKIYFNFGKHNGVAVEEVYRRERPYFFWILEKEFSSQVKQIVRKLLKDLDGKG